MALPFSGGGGGRATPYKARAGGAGSVTAVDLSHRMLEAARPHGGDPCIVDRNAALEAFEPKAFALDLMLARR